MFHLTLVLVALIGCCAGARIPGGLLPRLDGRIVGGKDTHIDDYPHQITMRYFGSHRCGGSVINENTILTAAHCVQGISPSSLQIIAGTSLKNGQGQQRGVKKIYIHERYTGYDFDLAILKLDGDLEFSSKVQPINLPRANSDPRVGDKAEVTGWGALKEGGFSPSQLQVVEVPIVARDLCKEAYKYVASITTNMVCAGVETGGKDACQGDSGGPMIIGKEIVGVVSWGYGCARKDFPGVYSNVGAMREWVDDILKKN